MSGLAGAVREPGAALLWEEGMALAPQHFQQMALRHEQLLAYQMAAMTPYPWGVVRLQFDVDVLPEGLVRVRELECVLPDGLVVLRREDRDPPLEIDVRPYQEAAARGPITIHLTVPAGRSITGAGGELARFDVTETPDVDDDSGSALPVAVRRLTPRLGLDITTAPRQRPPAKFIAMPLLRLAYDGRVFQQADFAPPALIVGDRSALWRTLQDLCRRAREKAHHLARQPAAQNKSGPQSALSRLELGGIASGLPALEALLGSGRSHPFTLYVELCRYLGTLSTLASGEVPPAPPRYDHDDPLAAFSEVMAAIERALAHSQRYLVSVYFAAEGAKFTLQLEPAWSKTRLLVGLRPRPNQMPADLTAWFERALVATQDRSQELWNLRVRGATRRPVDQASESELVAPADTQVFAVEMDSAYITDGQTLEIWNTDTRSEDMRPAEIILFVKG